MRKFLALLFALLLCTATKVYAEDTATVTVTVKDLPQKLQNRTVIVTLGNGPYLVQLAGRYPYYTKKIAEILGCTAAEVEPYVHLSILALNNYMIFNERALFLPQIEAAKKGLMQLAKRKE